MAGVRRRHQLLQALQRAAAVLVGLLVHRGREDGDLLLDRQQRGLVQVLVVNEVEQLADPLLARRPGVRGSARPAERLGLT